VVVVVTTKYDVRVVELLVSSSKLHGQNGKHDIHCPAADQHAISAVDHAHHSTLKVFEDALSIDQFLGHESSSGKHRKTTIL